ncbi:Zinc finger CCCH-type with G patch domain-containing protein [Cucumis melo var. makuwa]|uniref:Zinc finger CCCH-type with G patch domain-containing protein n=1 Tax=Cucumis melo var. makuwa TaxID=1194695 RepID=A0A5D3BXD8_CUCMM|nr:Zinc finger CCCH-type with G patch domain-containing protein [Cucumis melo var. makuwa]
MAKMGFVQVGGLGKDGQGMTLPIEVMKRPKSLGTGSRALKKSKKNWCFEVHTKGFGSKMIAKMRFVEGMRLGKDSQGIVNPLLPVRWPKALRIGRQMLH